MRSSRPPQVPPVPGRDLDIGPYTLANRIAVGGMAEVFRALDEPPAGDPRSVVIKRLLPDLADDPKCRRMFEREADLGLRIDHDNVVRVLDRGEDRGRPYIVLEYVFGVDLWRLGRHLLRTGKTLRQPVALYVMTEMLSGLAAVHSAKSRDGHPLRIEHRDVSPSNIFLSVHGDVKLGDLGIAIADMRENRPTAPRDERGRGKLGYLAPEIIKGVPSDQRSDLFSAGVVAAELLLGKPLFTGAGEIGILLAIRDADIRPFKAIAKTLPSAVDFAISAALAADPEARIQTAKELRAELLPHVDESVRKLRTELGRLVAEVLADTGATQPGDKGAMAETVERRWPDRESRPPALLDDDGRLHVQSDTGELVRVLDSTTVDDSRYEVTSPDGAMLGTFRLADMIRAIATRSVGPRDLVSRNGATPQPLHSFPHLVRHLPPSSRTPTLQKRTELVNTTESHNLAQGGLVTALAQALLHELTGLMLVDHEESRVEIYLAKGAPVYVASNKPEHMLGARLVQQGVLTQGELDMALAVMPRFDGRIGDTLSALGLVEPVTLVRHISAQVRERLLEPFGWIEGRSAFYGGVDAPKDLVALELDPWGVLEAGARLRLQRGLERDRFGGRDGGSLLRATAKAEHVLALRPEPAIASLLTMLETPTPLVRLDELNPAAAEHELPRSRPLVVVLLAMGALEWA
ncbi:MAG: serine/threonine protein kinase [Deltaproteobacteria bacterium]|nr:serine/threonine protein kinase [Deltaproteobacteria bacterium]